MPESTEAGTLGDAQLYFLRRFWLATTTVQTEGCEFGNVATKIPFAADANIQNWGSPELGRWGAMVRGHFFGLTVE